jgi:lipopolysaccharide export system protein LptA
VLKKTLKLVTTFALLLGVYLLYVRAFAVVVTRLTAARRGDDLGFVLRDSQSKKEAILRAREAFGPNHWTARDDLQLRYYNSERGFWMYSQKDERIIEEDGVRYDGKRIKLRPAAIIWRAKDGSSTKTVTADEAIIDFNQSLSLNVKPDSEPIVVRFAKLEGNVMIRDDRGTPHDLADDMVIGPLTWVKYDDSQLQIFSDSPVLIVDRDTRITGLGMLIQLRPKSAPVPGARSAGFEGAQSAQINQNVYVLFNDVAKTGFLPGSMQTKHTESGTVEVTAQIDQARSAGRASAKGKPAAEPVPLDLRCEGPMQVDFPKPHLPVKVGPPAPPDPTMVHFTRNVVVRRGKLTELPDQLDTDNLDLTLIPAEELAKARDSESSPGRRSEKRADAVGSKNQAEGSPTTAAGSEPVEEKGILGDLTLRRVKATGHAVWLQQPLRGAKIRCNEMIHDVAQSGGQNVTYFRVDAIRKLWLLEKFDFAQDRPQGPEGPARRQAQSVTYVWAQDATLFDTGGDMDHASLVARGPGRMETRPIPADAETAPQDVPADRIATWQDQLVLKNEIGPDQKLEERVLILKGRPRIIDRLQQSSLDAVETIVAWLRPEPTGGVNVASSTAPDSSNHTTSNPSSRDETFKIRRLLALRNVHLVAPSKDLTARNRLDADFEEAVKPVVSAPSTVTAQVSPQPAAGTPPARGGGSEIKTTENEAPAAAKPADPKMVALADLVEAKILIDSSGQAKRGRKPNAAGSTAPSAANPADPDSSYEIRDARMFGSVSLHQDPSPGKTKGQDAFGEALVLRNEGPGKAVFNLYDRDPRVKTQAPSSADRRPLAKVITEDQTIRGEVIGLNQKTDEAWVYGPGELVQLTDRNLMTDKAEGKEAQNPGKPGGDAAATDAKALKPRPRTRAGKVLAERVPLVITWQEKMLFHGRSLDPENRPAAKAEFYKKVRAEMEDGLLYCDKVMTTYTDQPIPLADLGKMSQARAQGGQKTDQAEDEEDAQDEKPKPDLTLIYLEGNAQAISRKVDPDRPVLLSRQRITGDRINYDRRTGDFLVPCAGMVFLHDRDNNASLQPGSNTNGPLANRRTIRPTSVKPSDRPGQKKDQLPPLVLTQIKFTREMRGRFGTGKGSDKTETRWAEFFGDIEAARALVPSERNIINYDRPPADTYFLTSQTMRVITVPPPPGAPENAPARNFLKAWENAYAKTSDTMIQADVITYDSQSDLIYANGQEGRLVQVVKQTAVGQPGSPTVADAVRVNPKTGAADVIGPRELQLVDLRTGTRPTPVPPPDPNAKPAKPPKNPFRPPVNNIERRGFSGR